MGTLNAIVPPKIYLDANIFIYALEDASGVGVKLRTLFPRFDSGELHAVTSELTLAEVLVKPIRDGNSAIVDTYKKCCNLRLRLQSSQLAAIFSSTPLACERRSWASGFPTRFTLRPQSKWDAKHF